MLFVGRESRGGAGFCRGAPLSHIDQSGCWRKICRNFGNLEILEFRTLDVGGDFSLWTSSKEHRPSLVKLVI